MSDNYLKAIAEHLMFLQLLIIAGTFIVLCFLAAINRKLKKLLERMQRYCCFIPANQQELAKAGKVPPGCGKKAEWTIIDFENYPDHSTDSCTEHVGELLTDAPEHRIYPINET